MIESKEKQFLEGLIHIFSIFVFGTISFFCYFFWNIPEFSWKSGLKLGIFLAGIFCYEIVIVVILLYYAIKAKNKFSEYLDRKPHTKHVILTMVLSITYLVICIFIDDSWILFLRDVVMVCLIIVGMPFVGNYFNKKTHAAENFLGFNEKK